MRYLITHSLLSAWLYAQKENPYSDATTEETGWDDFMKTLRREPTPTNEAMRNGIAFEDLVTDIVNNRPRTEDKWYEAAAKVAGIVKGAQLQYVATKRTTIAGMDFLLYGRLDALRNGQIFDIKFSKSYDRGKYFDSTQHPMYFALVPQAMNFTYVVSDGSNVWSELYWWDEARRIEPMIEDFISWLRVQGLLEIYQEKWVARA